jgi:hypothetical protein
MRTGRRPGIAACAGLCLAVLVSGCGAGQRLDKDAATPPVVPGLDTAGPDLSGVNIPAIVVPNVTGAVSRPRPRLTPGAVATTNITTVCTQPNQHVAIPFADQTLVYNEYGYTTPALQHKYSLDFLVPPDLGGSTAIANIWPAALRGVGFFQKEQLNHVLHDLVCRRSVTLAQAQGQIEKNWYATWLRYVVATGRA